MAIEIRIPKEINRYEAKFIGPFTLRQTISLVVCLPIGVGLFILTKPYIGTDLAGFLVVPPAAIGWMFGWYKPYGMKFEKYLRSVFINSFLAPRKRYYKTENYYATILKEIHKADEQAALNEGAGTSDKNKKRVKPQKYKRSKLAIK